MKNPWVIIGVIAVVLFGGAIWFSSSANEKNNEGVVIESHTKGQIDSPVTLVEYSDLQCPACASFQPALNQALETYGDKILFEYKHFPLPMHPYALQASAAAEAAGQQDAFFDYHDLLFVNQTVWSNSATPNTYFLEYAKELGLDLDLFSRHMNSTLLKERVRADAEEGRDLAVTGTPTFFLNGKRMEIQTFEDFLSQIAEAVEPGVTFGEEATSTSNGVEFSL